MAIQTRQQANGRTGGLWRMVGVAVGLMMSTGLILFSVARQQASTPQSEPAQHAVVVQPAELGIDLPSGADIRDLLRGIADYLRSGEWPGRQAMEQHALGIDLPGGADVATMPRGLTDYLRSETLRSMTMQSHPLGIDVPGSVDVRQLPHGLSDYLRPQTQ